MIVLIVLNLQYHLGKEALDLFEEMRKEKTHNDVSRPYWVRLRWIMAGAGGHWRVVPYVRDRMYAALRTLGDEIMQRGW